MHKLREKLYLKEHALADDPYVSTLSGSGDANLNMSSEASNSKRPNCCDELPDFDDDPYEPQVL